MESTLLIVGVNHRSAPVEVRERFLIPANRTHDALAQLAHADAVDEVLVLSTPERTEFVLWTRDASAASASVLNFLTSEYGLTLYEWKYFYRKLDETALAHLFLFTAGLDSLALREHECAENLRQAADASVRAGTLGRFLEGAVHSALGVGAVLHAQANREGMEQTENNALQEARTSFSKLLAERVVPTIVAMRRRLDEICLTELESFYGGLSSLTSEEREKIEAFAARLTQRIAGTLAHELKEPHEKSEQEHLTSAVQRLFHLEMAQRAMAQAKN